MDSRDPSVGVLHKSELVGRAWVQNLAVVQVWNIEASIMTEKRTGIKTTAEAAGRTGTPGGMLVYEREYRPLGVVCGIDEVGREVRWQVRWWQEQ